MDDAVLVQEFQAGYCVYELYAQNENIFSGARQMRKRVEMNIEDFVRELRVPTALSGRKYPKARLVAPFYGVYTYAR